jgi:hypothetical protein
MTNASIVISTIIPEAKDHGRAAKLSLRSGATTYHSEPFRGKASTMAQAIDDPYKLVRRAKAVAQRYGTGPYYISAGQTCMKFTFSWRSEHYAWKPFADRLQELGFTAAQIKEIALSR